MAINFCQPVFQPHISTSAVTSDGYGVENLAKDDNNMFQVKGFRAEYFIKPPIDVIFEFPCNIHIDKIIINPNLGAQKSCGLEIFTKNIPMRRRNLWLVENKMLDYRREDQKNDHGSGSVYDIETVVGKAYFKENDVTKVYFLNRRYRSRVPFHGLTKTSPLQLSGTVERDLRHHLHQTLSDVSHVIVRITRVFSGCVPALQKVEIYGQPSSSCGRKVDAFIMSIYKTLHELKYKKADSQLSGASGSKVTPSSEHQSLAVKAAQSISEFPTDFIDPITCDMMSLPVLLPSGHSVDQSTLDKHTETEAKWGRKANDPFTGLPFTDVSKPVPNVKLKSRIDQFLLKAGDSFKTAPRTVGRSTDVHNIGVPTMDIPRHMKRSLTSNTTSHSATNNVQSPMLGEISHTTQIHQDSVKNKDFFQLKSKSSQSDYTTNVSPRIQKRVPSSGNESMNDSMSVDWRIRTQFAKKRKLEESPKPSVSSSASGYHPSKATNHEERLALSLDDALQNTLGKLQTFRKHQDGRKSQVESNTGSQPCSSCSVHLQATNSSAVYKLPCQHLLCRKCLTEKTASESAHNKCRLCKMIYSSSQVERVYALT
ncbi:RING finger protein 37-like [Glandiceps talaboti]